MTVAGGRTHCDLQQECAAVARLQDELSRARCDLEALTSGSYQTGPKGHPHPDPASVVTAVALDGGKRVAL